MTIEQVGIAFIAGAVGGLGCSLFFALLAVVARWLAKVKP